MRALMLHVDSFSCTATERGRSKIVEEIESKSRRTQVGEALLVLASVEKADEANPDSVSARAAEEIEKLANQLKAKTIVLHSFAHLFGDLSGPDTALRVLKSIERDLLRSGFTVIRTPFGWFYTLELKAKGHPLSRIARVFNAVIASP